MVGPEFVSEAEDAVRARFRRVEVVLGTFEGSEFFDREVFGKAFDRKAVTTLQGRLILQVTWRHCSDPREDTESC